MCYKIPDITSQNCQGHPKNINLRHSDSQEEPEMG